MSLRYLWRTRQCMWMSGARARLALCERRRSQLSTRVSPRESGAWRAEVSPGMAGASPTCFSQSGKTPVASGSAVEGEVCGHMRMGEAIQHLSMFVMCAHGEWRLTTGHAHVEGTADRCDFRSFDSWSMDIADMTGIMSCG